MVLHRHTDIHDMFVIIYLCSVFFLTYYRLPSLKFNSWLLTIAGWKMKFPGFRRIFIGELLV